MTASEQRLHPASMLFDLGRYARIFAWPALLAFLSGGRAADPSLARYGGGVSESWLWILMVPSVVLSVARFLSFHIRYEDDALVIRSGILFRNVRHLPYARIQNLDAVQNVFHRALGVVEVRIETGGGTEPEARLSVLPAAALDAMRRHVFAGREDASPASAPVRSEAGARPATAVRRTGSDGFPDSMDLVVGDTPADAPAPATLLHLPLRDLLLCGFLENKGMVLVGAAYGFLWEAGVMDRLWQWLFAGEVDARGLLREVATALVGGSSLPRGRVLMAVAAVVAFLLLVRLVSMIWAVVRLYDFRLTRRGDDLRVTFGLLTRVTATIPRRRVQSLTIEQGWLHRRLGRASIRVETAGGSPGATARDREWLAPLVALDAVPRLVAEILAVETFEPAARHVHPHAFRRAVKPALLEALVLSAAAVAALGWRGAWLAAAAMAWFTFAAWQRVRSLRWTATDDLVTFRSGWLARRETLVRTNRIQSVMRSDSPFDRRWAMARVRVDTAGGRELAHGIDIPYLAAEVAETLTRRLSVGAARTAFRW